MLKSVATFFIAALVGVSAQTPTCAPGMCDPCGNSLAYVVSGSTGQGNAGYIINGATNPTLTLVGGSTYTFSLTSSAIMSTDPFFIKGSLTTGTSGLFNYGVSGNGQLSVTFTPPSDGSLNGVPLYYVSGSNIASSGRINVVLSTSCSGLNPTPYVQPTQQIAQSTTTNAPQYLSSSYGCYLDFQQARILPFQLVIAKPTFTRQQCSDLAFGSGYTYWAVEYGQECWAGNTIQLNGSYILNSTSSVAPALCTQPCNGNTAQTCGGTFAADVNIINQPPTVYNSASPANPFYAPTAGTFSPLSIYPYSTTLTVSASQYTSNALPNRDLLPVYAPFVTAGSAAVVGGAAAVASTVGQTTMALLYLNCATAQCLTSAQTVYLCIDPESCNAVGMSGYFTLPILNNPNINIFNKLRLIGTNGATNDYFITVVRYIPPTVAPTVASFKEVVATGCLQDSSTRILSTTVGTSGYTYETCYAAAVKASAVYFGLEFGGECYIGTSLLSAVASGSCNMACSANAAEQCGGFYAIQVYSIVNTAVNPLAAGCYVDSVSARLLTNKLYSGASLTQSACQQLAAAYGYLYYGVEFGIECWADFTYQYSPSPSGACNYLCSGNSAQYCGGFNAINLFQTNPLTAPPGGTAAPSTAATTVAATQQATTPYSGAKPNCQTTQSLSISYSSVNPNTAFQIAGLSGDNPTVNIGLNQQWTFIIQGIAGIFITTQPTYSANDLVSASQATIIGQGGSGTTSVIFFQSGTYYYTSQTNSNQHGMIVVAAYSCP